MSGIIHKINKLLEAKSLKKQVFAEKIGVSRDTVYNWTDENIKVSTLVKVSSVLGVSINHFLNNDKNTVNEPAADYGKKESLLELKEQCQEYREIIKGLTKSLNAVTDELKNKR